MAIIIPSQKIYEIKNPKVIKNALKQIDIEQNQVDYVYTNENTEHLKQIITEKETIDTKEAYAENRIIPEKTPELMFSAGLKIESDVASSTVSLPRLYENYYITKVEPIVEVDFDVTIYDVPAVSYIGEMPDSLRRFDFIDEKEPSNSRQMTYRNFNFSTSDTSFDFVNKLTSKANLTVNTENISATFSVTKSGFISEDTNDETEDTLVSKITLGRKPTAINSAYPYSVDISEETTDNFVIDVKFTDKITVWLAQDHAESSYSSSMISRPIEALKVTMVAKEVRVVFNETIRKLSNDTSSISLVNSNSNNEEAFSVIKNPFIRTKNTYLGNLATEVLYRQTLNTYANGKEISTIRCSIGEYKDENGNLVISTKTPDKMLFEHYDKVVPMIRNGEGIDEAISYNANGLAKIFDVVGIKIINDGAVWQELTLREAGETIDIPSAEKLVAPEISIQQNLLTIYDIGGKAQKFEILVDGEIKKTLTADGVVYFDLSELGLGYGSYKITVVSIADGYISSTPSNAVIYNIANPNIETLPTPYLTLDKDTLYIYGQIENAEKFEVWVNGSVRITITNPSLDLRSLNLGIGTFVISVVAKAKGYNDSAQSDYVTYVVEKKALINRGVYDFNEILDLSKSITQDLNAEILINSTNYYVKQILVGSFGVKLKTENEEITIYDSNGWTNSSYQSFEFLYNVEVYTSFYEWFFNNVRRRTIFFVIEDVVYQAESGMSWYEWCNSQYNIDNWFVGGNTSTEKVYRYTSPTTIEVVYDDTNRVTALDTIIDSRKYEVKSEFAIDVSSKDILEYVDNNFASLELLDNYVSETEVNDLVNIEVERTIDAKNLVDESKANEIVNKAIAGIEIDKFVSEGELTETLGSYSTTKEMETTISAKIGEFSVGVESQFSGLQDQIDGAISTWYLKGAPTTTNEPAKDWTTDEEKENHSGDLYYDDDTGYCYRWQKVDGAFTWKRIADEDVSKALEEAENARREAKKAQDMEIGGRNLVYYLASGNDSPIYHDATIISGNESLSHRWTLQKANPTLGTQIRGTVFEVGTTYTLSYFLKKTAGTLSIIGGHFSGFTQTRLSIDGKEVSGSYHSGISVNDDTKVHYVVVTGICNSAQYIWIQPNRGLSTSITYELWNIKVEKGEKATDWTPAWEEYYTTVQTSSLIKETADNINLSVTTLTNRLNTDYYTKTQIYTKSEIDVKTNSITLSVTEATTTANNAVSTAQSAGLKAETANTNATAAIGAANSASNTATSANTKAGNALSKANEIEAKLVLGIGTDTDGKKYSCLNGQADYIKFYSGDLEIASSQFTLDRAGNATFKGNLSAPTGELGGWTLGATSLTAGSLGDYSIPNDGYFYMSTANRASTDTISVGGIRAASWRLIVGPEFGVTSSGELYCRAGEIGGWSIDYETLYNNTTGIYAGYTVTDQSLISTGTSPIRFYAGNTTAKNAPFKVLDDGSFYASEADIKGNIEAKSGKVGNWYIAGGALSSQVMKSDGTYPQTAITITTSGVTIWNANGNQVSSTTWEKIISAANKNS